LGISCADWLLTSIYPILAALLAETPATCSLPHSENERQWSVNSFSCCIFGIQGFALMFEFITELLSTLLCKNTLYLMYNTDSKLIDIASFTAFKNISIVGENMILIRYYSPTPKTRTLIESMDGPPDNLPNSDGLGVYHRTVPKFTVEVYRQPGPWIWQWFSLELDLDLK